MVYSQTLHLCFYLTCSSFRMYQHMYQELQFVTLDLDFFGVFFSLLLEKNLLHLADSYIEMLLVALFLPDLCWNPGSVPPPPLLSRFLPLCLCWSACVLFFESQRLKKCPIWFDISLIYISLTHDGLILELLLQPENNFLTMTYFPFSFEFYWPLQSIQQWLKLLHYLMFVINIGWIWINHKLSAMLPPSKTGWILIFFV